MGNTFKEVLESTAPRICVIAAPGSGKTTKILIPKAQQVLDQAEVDPRQILLLTFSRLSALDLKKKVSKMERTPRASTVHSFCLSFLLSEDNHDIRQRIESVLLDFEKNVLLWDLKVIFPQRHKKALERELEEFSAGWARNPHEAVFEETEERRTFKYALTNWLAEHKASMMEEIVYNAVDLAKKLKNPQFILEPKFIFVDEFQDLNKLEQEFVEILARDSKLLLVVGDPDQSIYQFKFANPDGIREFSMREEVKVYSSLVTGRCPKRVVAIANEFLKQANPNRVKLLRPAEWAEEGEVHFVHRVYQSEEFQSIIGSMAERLRSGTKPESLIVLSPRRKLGEEFAEYANGKIQELDLLDKAQFAFVMKPQFNELEKRKILQFSLWINPNSFLHLRTYLGLTDERSFAAELAELKSRYGGLHPAIQGARPEDFPARKRRVRLLCGRVAELRHFLASHSTTAPLEDVLAELFPDSETEVAELRKILLSLREESDTPKALYAKFIDYIRMVPHSEHTVRVMTLRACKGLEAEHVYILGCNAGNIPGQNRSGHISDFDHENEQRRMLYVGLTRASKSATFSWSRLIPFRQARGHATSSVKTVTIDGEKLSQVGMSKFLQELPRVRWEY